MWEIGEKRRDFEIKNEMEEGNGLTEFLMFCAKKWFQQPFELKI